MKSIIIIQLGWIILLLQFDWYRADRKVFAKNFQKLQTNQSSNQIEHTLKQKLKKDKDQDDKQNTVKQVREQKDPKDVAVVKSKLVQKDSKNQVQNEDHYQADQKKDHYQVNQKEDHYQASQKEDHYQAQIKEEMQKIEQQKKQMIEQEQIKEKELQLKEMLLQQKEREIAQKEQQIKEKELQQKETLLQQMEKEIAQKEVQLKQEEKEMEAQRLKKKDDEVKKDEQPKKNSQANKVEDNKKDSQSRNVEDVVKKVDESTETDSSDLKKLQEYHNIVKKEVLQYVQMKSNQIPEKVNIVKDVQRLKKNTKNKDDDAAAVVTTPAEDTAGKAQNAAKDTAGKAQDAAKDAAGKAQDAAKDAAGKAQDATKDAADKAQDDVASASKKGGSKRSQQYKLPPIISMNNTVVVQNLKNDLMTDNKFESEFGDWEDADYVKRISEYAKQDLMYKVNHKQKQYNTIKNSFVKDKRLVEYPQIYKEIQYGQFTDVLTPVEQTTMQGNLWSNFKSLKYDPVQYKEREEKNSNIELQYDTKGNYKQYEKVINNHRVNVDAKMYGDIDKMELLLRGVENPLQVENIQREVNRDIKLRENGSASKTSIDALLGEIDKELKKH